jgi:hypothetical protein
MDAPCRKLTDWAENEGLHRRHSQRQLSSGVVNVPGVEVEQGYIRKQAGQKCHG